MRIFRFRILAAIEILTKKVVSFNTIFAIGAILSFFIYGYSLPMTLQLIIASASIWFFKRTYKILKVEPGFSLNVLSMHTVTFSFVFVVFLLSYYIIYGGYILFTSFSWLRLILCTLVFIFIIIRMSLLVCYRKLICDFHEHFKVKDTGWDAAFMEVDEKQWELLLNAGGLVEKTDTKTTNYDRLFGENRED